MKTALNKNALSKKDTIRALAEADLEAFIRLVHPKRVLGQVHRDIIRWWNRDDAKSHQLLLLPRDHQKSALIAYRVAWAITRNPAIRILYISSTSTLATQQLQFIKDILTSDIYRFYWPEMVNKDPSKRIKWTDSEIKVDHPRRKEENVRDSTIFTAGLTTTITGLHCDVAVLDDFVVDDNANNDEGRRKVREKASYLSSILGTEGELWVVGTRYHPKDLYNDFLSKTVDIYDQEGEIISSEPLFEVFERQVEDRGDGTGNYLWPRTQRQDGVWFGFDQSILAKKKAQYYDLSKFRAQYYNNPNDYESASITPDLFQYYDKKHLRHEDGKWFYNGLRLNVFAAVDFAYSLSKDADYTCIVVVGVDSNNTYYVLDIERFKTTKIGEYFDRILKLHTKWDFRKLRAEVTAAQSMIVESLKNDYIRVHGLALSIDAYRPGTRQGSKEERIDAILQPRYQNLQVMHFKGGNCELLEEELTQARPAHDDIKDALAAVIDICVPPSSMRGIAQRAPGAGSRPYINSRFGGLG